METRSESYFFGLGLCLGGLGAGLLAGVPAGLLSPVPLGTRTLLFVAVCVVAIVAELTGNVERLPQNRRLVPESVALDGTTGLLQFGLEMGTGMRTYITSAAPYVAAAWVVLHGSIAAGLAVGFGFGIGRWLLAAVRRAHNGPAASWAHAVESRSRTVGVVSTFAATAVAGTLILRAI